MYVQNYLLAFWQRLVWLDCVRYMHCVESHCALAPPHWLLLDTGWSLFRAHVVPVPESVKVIWVSVGVLLMTNVHLLRTWALAKCGCTHAVSGEHLLVQNVLFSSSAVCVVCSAPVEDKPEPEHHLAKYTMPNLLKLFVQDVDDTPTLHYHSGKTLWPHVLTL